MKLIIDADACPREVLAYCVALCETEGIDLITIASFNHHVQSPHHIVVGNASQEADIKIVNLTESGNIVVTQDWGLAAMVLGKGAFALSPSGREYRQETMDFLLEEREMKAKFRRAGHHTKGPKKRQKQDNVQFKESLEQMILHIKQQE
ncbi:uncharacterized protein YaiI (UPF0178 family) [Sporomusaceae bacterium BoRhaA]|uniref:YaiI/YqxD family protein n=1 Tax=Pelorhabdus rhamnosifermentans TaxID=2772457 RepID=UPI001C061732|nr:DUF188 domain-containing protein [Pelorhabdus rhamnosifermentans]MBU2703590.1 uncharacterized protein YaiI (UPF0178 family) [Pelorhabdus rhamnosifermentans]